MGSSKEVPPRTRGFTQVDVCDLWADHGSSAHARVHPRNTSRSPTSRWFLRARAGSPTQAIAELRAQLVPPRTRGFTRHVPPRGRLEQGSSAHARVDPPRTRSSSRACWFLRARAGFWLETKSMTAIAKSNPTGTRSLVGHSLDVAFAAQKILSTGVTRARLSRLAGFPLTDVHVDRLSVLVGLHDFGKATQGFQVRIGALAGADGGHLAEAHAGLRHTKIGAA